LGRIGFNRQNSGTMDSIAQQTRSVFAPVIALNFNSAQFDECKTFLESRVADTERLPVVDPRQLVMTADGRLAETGYRFNAIGFAAVANALMSGLVGVFNDLSGESRNRFNASSESGELAAAVSIYNTALRSRFDVMRERTLLADHRSRTIEGCLGIEHKLLDNAVFFNTIAEELEAAQPNAEFYRAEVIGRELRVYYMDVRSRRTDVYRDPRHTFAAGWYFSNREDAGLAMRATNCLFTKFGPAVDGRSRHTNLRHVGADFFGRATLLIRKAAGNSLDMATVSKAISRLNSVPLNFSEDRAVFNSALAQWMGYLGQFKIGREFAKHIARNAAVIGSDMSPRNPLEAYNDEILTNRNMYDLFCATLRYSKNQYHTVRDLLQSAAMQMLLPTKQ
jgi:hypothetical protein